MFSDFLIFYYLLLYYDAVAEFVTCISCYSSYWGFIVKVTYYCMTVYF